MEFFFADEFIKELDYIENDIESMKKEAEEPSMIGLMNLDYSKIDYFDIKNHCQKLRKIILKQEIPNDTESLFPYESFFHEDILTLDDIIKEPKRRQLHKIIVVEKGYHYVKVINIPFIGLSYVLYYISQRGISDEIYIGLKFHIFQIEDYLKNIQNFNNNKKKKRKK